jgi:hypothetical protein
MGGLDPTLSKPDRDAANFQDRPADQRRGGIRILFWGACLVRPVADRGGFVA